MVQALEVELARLQGFDTEAGAWTPGPTPETGSPAGGATGHHRGVVPAWRRALIPVITPSWWSTWAWWPFNNAKTQEAEALKARMHTPPDDAIAERQRLLCVLCQATCSGSCLPVVAVAADMQFWLGHCPQQFQFLGVFVKGGFLVFRRYAELVESQKKCAKLAARKAAAIKAKAEHDAAQAKTM